MADAYSTVSIVQTQTLDNTQHLVDSVRVDFVSADGAIQGTVTVPLTADWGTAADAAILAFIEQAQIVR